MPLHITDIAEVEENPYHPHNDAYHKEIKHLQNIIMVTQREMRPQHVAVAKMHFAGRANVDIAKELDYTPNTISNILHREDVQKLLTLLNYVDAAMSGPTSAHRRAVLTRIMVDNENKNPKIALQAIAEMNKMDMNQHAIDTGDLGHQPTQVIINQNYFPKTALDE